MIECARVRVSELFAGVEGWLQAGAADAVIASLSYRSDQVEPGCLFFCVPGFVHDGHDFAAEAVERGAAALCVERPLDIAVPQVVVPSTRAAMGPVAAAFYGHPSSRLRTVGITGTNGKTTSAFIVAHLLDRAGMSAGLLGTVERRVGGRAFPAGRTTPETLDIQRDLALMVEAGDRAAVMEVSSHALDLGRVRGIDFDVVAFTNLTQDHLDYHKTMEEYFAAKRRLFLEEEFASAATLAVINVDDPYGLRLAQECCAERVLSVSTSPAVPDWGPVDLQLSDYSTDAAGAQGTLVLRGRALHLLEERATIPLEQQRKSLAWAGVTEERATRSGADGREIRVEVTTRLVGAFNVANTAVALGIGLGLGLDLGQMLAALADFEGVPGRMEPVRAGQEFAVFVDYAHTPASVAGVLRAARDITQGRLIVVLGCGGDRDRSKRPLMGREAEKAADLVIVTSDNPRTEEPLSIIADILQGLERPDRAQVEPDRRLAIAGAVGQARPGDVVMILGKGHESGQEFATMTVPFDDRKVAWEALTALRVGAQ